MQLLPSSFMVDQPALGLEPDGYLREHVQVTVDVLVIEARGDDEAKDRTARALLEHAGMVFYGKQATNHWCATDGCWPFEAADCVASVCRQSLAAARRADCFSAFQCPPRPGVAPRIMLASCVACPPAFSLAEAWFQTCWSMCLAMCDVVTIGAGISGEASTLQQTPLVVQCASSTAQQAQHSGAATGSRLPVRRAQRPCEAV